MKITSFSYKDGGHLRLAQDTRVFDCRELDNPYYHPVLRTQTGLEQEVQDFVLLKSRRAQVLLGAATVAFAETGGDLAFGCVGGKHRSVAVAEVVAKLLRLSGAEVEVVHTALPAALQEAV